MASCASGKGSLTPCPCCCSLWREGGRLLPSPDVLEGKGVGVHGRVGGSSLSRAAENTGMGARSPGGPLPSLQLVPTVFPEPALRFVRVMGAGSTEVLGAGEWG